MAEIDASVEEQEFLQASEEYANAESEKKRWSDEAKYRLKAMQEKHRALSEAREGKTTIGAFAEEGED